MAYTFTLMNEDEARAVVSWRYEPPYNVYNMGNDGEQTDLSEFLDRSSPYYAVRDEQGALVGDFCYGTASQPWTPEKSSLYVGDRVIVIGLAMHPDLTSKGTGTAFVRAGMDFARQQFAPRLFRLYVMPFNTRAIRVYEHVGFHTVRTLMVHNMHGDVEFVEMETIS